MFDKFIINIEIIRFQWENYLFNYFKSLMKGKYIIFRSKLDKKEWSLKIIHSDIQSDD